jgi:hypothetical protein
MLRANIDSIGIQKEAYHVLALQKLALNCKLYQNKSSCVSLCTIRSELPAVPRQNDLVPATR